MLAWWSKGRCAVLRNASDYGENISSSSRLQEYISVLYGSCEWSEYDPSPS